MKFETSTVLVALMGVAAARPDAVRMGSGNVRREVPQEHSHEDILQAVNTALKLDNPENIQDAVFSLLGNAAAAAGAGSVTNLDCLQQHVADQAFTNAKAAGDVDAMANALMFRAVERNTGKVGLASVICNETATNAEVAAVTQHQDPASDNAAATNKQIVLDLAVQLNSIGADPQLALKTGTFAPGDTSDATGKGNSCDDIVAEGCINAQNLLVEDATAAEIDAAVSAGGATGSGASNSTATVGSGSSASGAAAADDTCDNTADSSTATGSASSAASSSAAAASSGTATTASGTNVNAFTGSTGAAPVPVESSASSDRPFSVNGDTFINIGAAVQRACDVQKNQCANAANSGGGGSVSDCDTQQQACIAANTKKRGLRAYPRAFPRY
ncbi:hypothetical protein KJ359_008096 [Pestalotiopsis sp. 9143b]|nr:hypothetical protein KJ359_008096 [Pestalotiopsis sp. 9143b]